MTIVYQLPMFGRGLAWKTLGGWEIASMTSMVSGAPVNITSGLDSSLTGVGNDRPDLVGNPVREHSSKDDMLARFFDPAAFVQNQPGRYGNVGRNLINGVAQSTTDLALVKAFPIGVRFGKLQFRAEFYNSLNHVTFCW